jgi:hypothetical protein
LACSGSFSGYQPHRSLRCSTSGSPQARDLGDRIEEFGRTAVTTGLHALSG